MKTFSAYLRGGNDKNKNISKLYRGVQYSQYVGWWAYKVKDCYFV